jgi:predicted esterase
MKPLHWRSRVLLIIRVSMILMLGSMSSSLQAQFVETARQNVIVSPEIHGFWEYLPSDYFANPNKKYPLLVAFHGIGETGVGTLPSMQSLLVHGVPRVIEANIFPQPVTYNGQSYSYIVLNPQYMDLGVGVMDVDAMLNYAFAHYHVDLNRVYLTGYSYGANLCYQYAGNNNVYAQKVTAIVPLAPCIDGDYGASRTIAANNVAAWGIHCSQDDECSASFTVDWANLINTANNNVPPAHPAVYTLTEVQNPTFPHDIFWLTYDPSFSETPTFKNIYNWLIQFSRNVALPIVLKSFTVENDNGRAVLDWITTNESNTKTFNIERASKDLQFHTIASLPANGFSSSDKEYKWIDEHPIDGINFYRLQLVNADNSKEVFEIRKLVVGNAENVNLLSSNPLQGLIRLSVELASPQELQFTLTDMQGRILYKKSNAYSQGPQLINIQSNSLPSGTYILKVTGDTFSRELKLVKN